MDTSTHASTTIKRNRRAGVLLHITSLPGEGSSGDLGHQAYRFIEFLHGTGFKVWQTLPIGPVHDDNSPYQCLSSHAGNPLLISLDWLRDRGWLDKDGTGDLSQDYRYHCLHRAYENYKKLNQPEWETKWVEFVETNDYWLKDYATFMVIKNSQDNLPWYEWPVDLRHRKPESIDVIVSERENELNQIYFEQFIFFTQWQEIREYARKHDIELFGDLPIFVARDSADVWAERDNFLMDNEGNMNFVAGVPPDAFSDTGQRWGNPLYDWEFMQQDDFNWWKKRFRTQFKLFDIVRIDHFRGLQACWYIPACDETAENGYWKETPGNDLLSALYKEFNQLPLIAEDLGVITEEVIALKNEYQLPGMKVLQFAFDGSNKNPHLPHRHLPGDIVYTGTHDNDTTLGWYQNSNNYNREYFKQYTGINGSDDAEALQAMIKLAFSSVSFLAVIPMQDILRLDASARMNVPGTAGGNWQWQFSWEQLPPDTHQLFSNLMNTYQR